MIQVLIPMSGQGTRYKNAGYCQPKPLIPVSGRPIIERLLQKFPIEWPVTFVLAENHQESDLPEVLSKLRPEAKLLFIPIHNQGPSFAIKAALPHLDQRLPILVSYCDYGFKWDPWDFADFALNSKCQSALLSYRGFHAHYLSPVTYAYSRLDGERVVEVREKGSFTANRENEFASAGAYYFDSVETLNSAIKAQEHFGLSLNGEYYTSLTVEALLRSKPNADVRVYEISAFYQWGTPEDLQIFEYWEKTFKSWVHHQNHSMEVDNVNMPMAGLGSRFKNFCSLPKPFLKIDETPMYRLALNSLPRGKETSFVTLASARSTLRLLEAEKAEFLDETPPGQAFSVKAGLTLISETGDLLISACDHSLVLNPETWNRFRSNPDCDAAIFIVKGYPGPNRRPQAFAYVNIGDSSDEFAEVKKVSVKHPISNKPSQDPLLVGSFWFKNKEILEANLVKLIASDCWVNGEIYLDSIFNIMVQNNLKVRTIPLDGYVNWGDPDSLAEALYWKEVFFGHRLSKRSRLEGVSEC